MAELTIEQKKLAVEKGLAQFMPDTVLQRVLQYWESEYGNQPSYVLNRFLSEICTNDEMRLQRKDMLRQVLHEISVVEKQQRLKVKNDKSVAVPKQGEEVVDSFQAFYDFVMAILKSVARNDYLEFVEEIQLKMKKHRSLAEYWYTVGSERESLQQFSPQNYAPMITVLYAIYCDFYGPIKADQLYALIKNDIKQRYPEVDVKQFL
ncbi:MULTISPECIES: hypothetical protein [Acinetobacter]|uniref:hypothetical protein n=1 Tax=Acinetobacter TaxID=469 RepID=UPI000C63148A|nr:MULTISPECIES: hypothetical protein [unclassified Acinetobacter]MBC70478.1 hypothetical protein [Acinetobacter sp.]MBT50780.1 hypothetical protein [Acinetobacter sp.]